MQSTQLGHLLVKVGAIGARRLEEAFRRQVVYGGALDTVLLELAALDEARLRAALAEASGLPPLPEGSTAQVTPELTSLGELCARLHVAPIGVAQGTLQVVVCETSHPQAISQLAAAAGMPVERYVAPEYVMWFHLERVCQQPMPPRFAALARRRLGASVRELLLRQAERGQGRDPVAAAVPAGAIVPPELLDWDFEDPAPTPAPGANAAAPAPAATGRASEPAPGGVLRALAKLRPLEEEPAWGRLAEAEERDSIFDALVELARARLEFAAVFTIHGPTAVLRVPPTAGAAAAGADLFVPLEEATAFRAAVETAAPYLGRVDASSSRALERLGRHPEVALWLPVQVAGRVVALLYGDRGARPPDAQEVADLARAGAEASRCFHGLILRSKRGTFGPAGEDPVGKLLRLPAPLQDIALEYAPFYVPVPDVVARAPRDRELEGDGAQALSPVLQAPAVPGGLVVRLAPPPGAAGEEAVLSEAQRAVQNIAGVASFDKAQGEALPSEGARTEGGRSGSPEARLAGDLTAAALATTASGSRGLVAPPGGTRAAGGTMQAVASPAPVGLPADERASTTALGAAGDPDALANVVATGSEIEARRAADALLQAGPNGLDALLRRFPGPLRLDRRSPRAGELPAVVEHGPILRALSRFGRRAVPPLIRLSAHANADVRFYAVYLFTELCFPEVLAQIVPRLFDGDGQVRGVALEVIRRFGDGLGADVGGVEYAEVLDRVRADLVDPDPEHARQAATALGELRDPQAVPRLTELLKHRESRVADAVHRALVQITKQDFGTSRWRWRAWWDRNRLRHRIEWMLDGLAHRHPEVRLSASEELKNLTHEYFGYHYDLPKREREEARERWVAWWQQLGRKRYGVARGLGPTSGDGPRF
jgi:hypothetical protein